MGFRWAWTIFVITYLNGISTGGVKQRNNQQFQTQLDVCVHVPFNHLQGKTGEGFRPNLFLNLRGGGGDPDESGSWNLGSQASAPAPATAKLKQLVGSKNEASGSKFSSAASRERSELLSQLAKYEPDEGTKLVKHKLTTQRVEELSRALARRDSKAVSATLEKVILLPDQRLNRYLVKHVCRPEHVLPQPFMIFMLHTSTRWLQRRVRSLDQKYGASLLYRRMPWRSVRGIANHAPLYRSADAVSRHC